MLNGIVSLSADTETPVANLQLLYVSSKTVEHIGSNSSTIIDPLRKINIKSDNLIKKKKNLEETFIFDVFQPMYDRNFTITNFNKFLNIEFIKGFKKRYG